MFNAMCIKEAPTHASYVLECWMLFQFKPQVSAAESMKHWWFPRQSFCTLCSTRATQRGSTTAQFNLPVLTSTDSSECNVITHTDYQVTSCVLRVEGFQSSQWVILGTSWLIRQSASSAVIHHFSLKSKLLSWTLCKLNHQWVECVRPVRLLNSSLSLTGGDGEISYDGRFMCQSSVNATLLLSKRSLG